MEDERTPSGGMLDFGKSMGGGKVDKNYSDHLSLIEDAALLRERTLEFDNSPSMGEAQAEREAQEGKERAVHEEYDREMDNIKEHGPLDRATERVLSEEEQKISILMEKGSYEEVKQVVRGRLEDIGADGEDFQTLDYFERYIGDPDPEVKDIITQMSLLTIRLMKLRGKNR